MVGLGSAAPAAAVAMTKRGESSFPQGINETLHKFKVNINRVILHQCISENGFASFPSDATRPPKTNSLFWARAPWPGISRRFEIPFRDSTVDGDHWGTCL